MNPIRDFETLQGVRGYDKECIASLDLRGNLLVQSWRISIVSGPLRQYEPINGQTRSCT